MYARILEEHGGNVTAAAAALGIPRTTLRDRVARGDPSGPLDPVVSFPVLPESLQHPHEIISRMCSQFTQAQAAAAALQWPRYQINIGGPFAINWFGDPHVDDNGCNWPLLTEHMRICRETPGMYAGNIGDTTNNWVGRLERLYADQDTSRETARILARYLIEGHPDDSPSWHGRQGLAWLIWLMGNHDRWSSHLCSWMQEIGAHIVPMHDWQAKITLACPNGREIRIWAAHDFAKAHSMWNSLHSAERTAKMKEIADLYICGHTHNWAIKQEESASRGFTYWLARARGYKFMDDYSSNTLGHMPQKQGASIVTVIDPDAKCPSSLIHCFADPAEAAEFLTWKRSRQ